MTMAMIGMAAVGVPHEEVWLVSREGSGLLLLVNWQHRVPEAAVRAKAKYLSLLLGIGAEVGTELLFD